MGKLDGKVALITGGISGIGAASAELFAKEGAKLALLDLDEEKGQKFAQDLKDKGHEDVIFLQADVADEDRCKEVIESVVEEFGQIDILFNNAGIGPTGSTHEYEFDTWRKTVAVNLDAVFLYTKQALKYMLEQESGVVINTASMYGIVAAPQSQAYNASKAAVINFSRSVALEYADKNIRVNALCPGYIETPILPEDLLEGLTQATPMKRLGTSEEIAKSALFLASDDSSFMTGSALTVDGGYTAQ